MFSMIFDAIGGVKTLMIAAAMALVVGLGWWVQDTIRTLERDKATLTQNNLLMEQTIKTNKKALDDLLNQHTIDLATIQKFHETSSSIDAKTNKIIQEIHNVPQPKDCLRDPAIDVAITRLRVGPGTTNSDSGKSNGSPSTK